MDLGGCPPSISNGPRNREGVTAKFRRPQDGWLVPPSRGRSISVEPICQGRGPLTSGGIAGPKAIRDVQQTSEFQQSQVLQDGLPRYPRKLGQRAYRLFAVSA